MNDVGNYIKSLRQSKGMTQEELGNIIGVKKAAVQKWESGLVQNLKRETIKKLADFFEVNPSTFIDVADSSDISNIAGIFPVKKIRIPMLGEIACGVPIFADQQHEQYVDVNEDYNADFCLKAKGDSMINANISSGDVVLISKMPMVNNGEIAAVIVDDEATLKRVYYYREKNKLILQAENPAVEPLVYVDEELDTIRILGKAVAVIKTL